MRLKGEELSQRLEGYSTSTMQLISDVLALPKEAALRSLDITTDSELTEEQVVERLQRLLEEHKART